MLFHSDVIEKELKRRGCMGTPGGQCLTLYVCECVSSPVACPQCTEGLTVHPGCEPANQNALPAGPPMHMLMKPSPCALSLGIKEGFVTNFAAFWNYCCFMQKQQDRG